MFSREDTISGTVDTVCANKHYLASKKTIQLTILRKAMFRQRKTEIVIIEPTKSIRISSIDLSLE